MTFVVRRPRGQWEIRESRSTPAGPRSRTLATFRVLDDRTLARAESAATNPFDREQVVQAARRAGAAVDEPAADRAARDLLRELAGGGRPAPGLRRLLLERLAEGSPVPELRSGTSVADWVGSSLAARGVTLRDLLDLADRLPAPRRRELEFPILRAVSDAGG